MGFDVEGALLGLLVVAWASVGVAEVLWAESVRRGGRPEA